MTAARQVRYLLVELSARQHAVLQDLPGASAASAADVASRLHAPRSPAERDPAIGSDAAPVDVVVIGSRTSSPLVLVQQVFRVAPAAGVAVLTTAETEERVRRQMSYAPGVPLDLLVLGPGEQLVAAITGLAGTTAERHRHVTLLAAVAARAVAAPLPRQPVVAAVGALLEHAPLGVLVCDFEGTVMGWNRHAQTLLDLTADMVGESADVLLPEVDRILDALRFSSAPVEVGAGDRRATGRSDPDPVLLGKALSLQLRGPQRIDVEVTGLASQLDDGRPVALLLVVDVTERRDAERIRDRLAGHVDLLGQVSEALLTTLDTGEALESLTRALVPSLADGVAIQLADATGGLGVVALHHRDPAVAGRTVGAAGGQLRDLFGPLGAAHVLAVALPGREHVLGSLVLVNQVESGPFSATDRSVGIEVGRRAGIALDNARLYAQQRELATELQRSLLTEPPQPAHLQIVTRYVAAAREAQVGGDWYDAYVQSDGATVLVIGDVIGHNTRSAAAMGQLRGVLRGIGFTTSAPPDEILSRVDQAIEGLLIATTATAAVVRLEQTPGEREQGLTRISWSNAGHPPPIAVLPDGHVTLLTPDTAAADACRLMGSDDTADLLLGLDPATPRHTWRMTLPRDTVVLLYTDGLVERRAQSLDVGIDRLAALLAEAAPSSLDELCETVLSRMLPQEPEDDVALVAVRLHGADAPRHAETHAPPAASTG